MQLRYLGAESQVLFNVRDGFCVIVELPIEQNEIQAALHVILVLCVSQQLHSSDLDCVHDLEGCCSRHLVYQHGHQLQRPVVHGEAALIFGEHSCQPVYEGHHFVFCQIPVLAQLLGDILADVRD